MGESRANHLIKVVAEIGEQTVEQLIDVLKKEDVDRYIQRFGKKVLDHIVGESAANHLIKAVKDEDIAEYVEALVLTDKQEIVINLLIKTLKSKNVSGKIKMIEFLLRVFETNRNAREVIRKALRKFVEEL